MIIIIIIIIAILINITVTVILEKSSGESSKQGTQGACSTPIHHVKFWISRFRGTYRTLTASEGKLFLILLKGLRPLYKVTRSSVLVLVGVLYLPLYFIIIVVIIFVIIINIALIVNIIFITSITIRIFIKSSLLFLWGRFTVWFCFFQFLHLSQPDPRDHHLVLTHYLDIIIWHHLIMVTWRQET